MKKHLLFISIVFVITTSLCQAQIPALWGMEGGTPTLTNFGSIFQTNSTGSSFNEDYIFYGPTYYPKGDLIQANNGLLYGMVSEYGTNGYGAIFSYNISSGKDTVLHFFGIGSDGQYPQGSLLQGKDGILYGMTSNGGTADSGIIFSYNISTGVETVLHNFGSATDGAVPNGSLSEVNDSMFYGMTSSGGVFGDGIIFSYNILTGKETDIHDFGSGTDGQSPNGSLIQASNGLLYGMTEIGGTNNEGIIFSFNISIGKEADIHDFGSGTDGQFPDGSLIQVNDSILYGMTSSGGSIAGGTIFSYNISTGIEIDLHDFGINPDGFSPRGSLILGSNGLLYGMTSDDGVDTGGIIFSYNISNGVETILHTFHSGTDGRTPYGSLIQLGTGILYGMTVYGGTFGLGTIFSSDTTINTETEIYDFGDNAQGQSPIGSLIQVGNNLLYGLTQYGGSNDSGTIFSYNISSGTEIDLHNFNGADGRDPQGSLIQANNGLLYGMTYEGGTNHVGTIFRYNISNSLETDMHDFGSGTDGQRCFYGSLIQASNNLLYGVTTFGGVDSLGIVFSYNIVTGRDSDLHDFAGSGIDGAFPMRSLLQANNGLLYGMTWSGGTNYLGTIFSYNILTGVETDLYNFGSGTDGQYPYNSLIQAGDSSLYGMTTQGGKYSDGIIFSYDISTGMETDLHDFGSGTDGQSPKASLMQASDGMLYGMTTHGGTFDYGTVFSYNIKSGIETVIHNFTGPDGDAPLDNLIEADLIDGYVKNAAVNFVSGTLDTIPFDSGVEVVLYQSGNAVDSVTPNSTGFFQFAPNPTNSNYLLFRYNNGNGTILSVKDTGVNAGTSLNIKIPDSLLIQIDTLVDSLQNKIVSKTVFNGLLDSDINCIGYNEAAVLTLTSAWENTTGNDSQYVNALARLLIAQYALQKLSNNASLMTGESMYNSFYLAEILAGIVVISDQLAILSTNSPYAHKVSAEINKLMVYGLETNLVEITNFIRDATVRSNYKANIQGELEEVRTEVERNLPSQFSPSGLNVFIESILLEQGSKLIYQNAYLPVTQPNVLQAVNNAADFNFSGTFDSTFQAVASSTGNSIVAASNANTSSTLDTVVAIQNSSNIAHAAGRIFSLASSIGSDTDILIDIDSATVPVASIIANLNPLVIAGTFGIPAFQVDTTVRNTDTATQWSFTRSSHNGSRSSNDTSLQNAISNYAGILNTLVNDVNANERAGALLASEQLMISDASLNSVINQTIIPINAAIPSSDFTDPPAPPFDTTRSLPIFLKGIDGSIFSRGALYFYLDGYIVDSTNSFYPDSIKKYATSVLAANNNLYNAIQNVQDSLANIQLPAYVQITSTTIPAYMLPDTILTVRLSYENFGSSTAKNLYCKLSATNGFTLSTDSIYIGSLAANDTGSKSFMLNAVPVDTVGYFTAQFYADSNLGNGYGAPLLTDNVTPPFPLGIPIIINTAFGKIICYPNPFNNLLHINYNLTQPSYVSINLYDDLGRKMPFYQGYQQPGFQNSELSAKSLSGGIYIIEVVINGISYRAKVVLLR